MANPASLYCLSSGGKELANDGYCTFADGTRCEPWAFFRAECGQAHSYCAKHGGTVKRKEEHAGSATLVYATCTVGGVTCAEESFARTGKCL